MITFYEQLRTNRRANDFLKFCSSMWEHRTGTQLAWLVDSAVRTYAPEMLGENFTESEIWPRLRPKVIEDLKRVGFQAWSVRNTCPIEQLDPDEFELADHVIIAERLNRGELPRFEQYELPTLNPWVFVGVGPESGHTLPRPRWWNRPRMYWRPTLTRHNGRPNFEPVVSVRPSYDAPLMEIRADLRRLGLPLEARNTNAAGLFDLVWDRSAVPLPAVIRVKVDSDLWESFIDPTPARMRRKSR